MLVSYSNAHRDQSVYPRKDHLCKKSETTTTKKQICEFQSPVKAEQSQKMPKYSHILCFFLLISLLNRNYIEKAFLKLLLGMTSELKIPTVGQRY